MASKTNAIVENYSTEGYHGTSQDRATAILSGNFKSSSGDDHWLGAGVYFFETGISNGLDDAKNWGKVSAWDNEKKSHSYTVYSVIKAGIHFERLWDLSTKDGLELFEYMRSSFRKKGLKSGDPQSGRKFDNSVIEFSADLMKFDGLRAWFYIKLDAKSRKMQVQSGIQNVTVLCVRKPSESISLDQLSREADGYVNR